MIRRTSRTIACAAFFASMALSIHSCSSIARADILKIKEYSDDSDACDDSADDDEYLNSLEPAVAECITEDAPKAGDGDQADQRYQERVAECVLQTAATPYSTILTPIIDREEPSLELDRVQPSPAPLD